MPLNASILCQLILHLYRFSSMKSNVAMSTYTSNNIGCIN
ncbi:putative orphan protein [Pseudoalteromonas translucida]|uniref:Orphan protein n=1 Tax=Pseudoalteromonas translucida (strain TAC 125) TaxID=326442 RepID=Q3IIV7_PSET1|nr:putative orphan protein [Pseudoalteromonas translucida]